MNNKKKSRVCIVTPVHWRAFMGGSQYQIKCLIDELLALDRFDITYLAYRVAPEFHTDRYSIVPIDGGVPRLGFTMHAVPLYRALKAARPDVIYQRVACGYTGVAAYYACRRGSRLVWHVAHDSDVTPDSSIHGRNLLRRYIEKRSVEYGIRHAHQIVTQTKLQAELLRRNYGRVASALVPNFHPPAAEKIDKSGSPTVLWVANLKPWKQPEAFVRLARALGDLQDVRFTMVGALMPGPQAGQWRQSLLSDIDATPNLEYLGQKSQDEVNELMARAHIFVNTSKSEGFANTFVQAWIREAPVVSLHVNPDDVLTSERVGVHAGSEERLHQVVRSLLTNPDERREYAARASAYAARQHSLRNAHILADILDKGNAGADQSSR